MADLTCNFAGIASPNPFWVASGPPANTAYQAHRAFEAGWGGLVWKTISPTASTIPPRYSSLDLGVNRMMGLNHLERASTRPPETNFRELAEVKRRWPRHAVVASLLADTREQWRELVQRTLDAGADGIELSYTSLRHSPGAGERPLEYAERVTDWVAQQSTIPVIVKLSPDLADFTGAARIARRAGARALALIDTFESITRVNLTTLVPEPAVGDFSAAGGYSGPAVKPLALRQLQACAADAEVGLPLAGLGGIGTWRDAAEFIALGATTLQVCTAIMHRGFRIVDDLTDGLNAYLDAQGMKSLADLRGRAVRQVAPREHLDARLRRVARIDYDRCIGCNLCYLACEDGAYQSIDLLSPDELGLGLGPGRIPHKPVPKIRLSDCVGCNLCALVCPVDDCITMTTVETAAPR